MNLKTFLRSERFRELFVYGVVGVITTAVNWGVYTLFSRACAALLGIPATNAILIFIATALGWAASVAFAFWANKKFVFRSPGWDSATLKKELPEFITARLLSLGFDAAFVELAVHLIGMNDLVAKLLSNVIVVILNYFASKFWIFRKKG
ncbi:MAG: GtrA family protein [Clostridia bacterium]|nr:GtrA family protein [Clostridia bacterium]